MANTKEARRETLRQIKKAFDDRQSREALPWAQVHIRCDVIHLKWKEKTSRNCIMLMLKTIGVDRALVWPAYERRGGKKGAAPRPKKRPAAQATSHDAHAEPPVHAREQGAVPGQMKRPAAHARSAAPGQMKRPAAHVRTEAQAALADDDAGQDAFAGGAALEVFPSLVLKLASQLEWNEDERRQQFTEH